MSRSLSLALLQLIIFLCLMPLFTHAQAAQPQGGFVPLTNADFQRLFGVQQTSGSVNDLGTFLNGAFRAVLSLGAILAVMRIAWGGYQYMTSDAWGEKSHAKEILGDVVLGLLLLMSAWLILYQINPDILKLKLKGITNTPTQNDSARSTQGASQPF